MDNNTNMNNTNTALTEEEREEELIKTIKMEPILETTELKEDAPGTKPADLIHYFTCGPDEVKCWTVRKGSKAPKAAV